MCSGQLSFKEIINKGKFLWRSPSHTVTGPPRSPVGLCLSPLQRVLSAGGTVSGVFGRVAPSCVGLEKRLFRLAAGVFTESGSLGWQLFSQHFSSVMVSPSVLPRSYRKSAPVTIFVPLLRILWNPLEANLAHRPSMKSVGFPLGAALLAPRLQRDAHCPPPVRSGLGQAGRAAFSRHLGHPFGAFGWGVTPGLSSLHLIREGHH